MRRPASATVPSLLPCLPKISFLCPSEVRVNTEKGGDTDTDVEGYVLGGAVIGTLVVTGDTTLPPVVATVALKSKENGAVVALLLVLVFAA